MLARKLLFAIFLIFLSACASSPATLDQPTEAAPTHTRQAPSATIAPTITLTPMPTPILIQAVFPSPVSVAQDHSCALTAGGGVKCWGNNSYGQLGDGTIINRFAPKYVLGLASGVRAVSAGGNHTCALMISGGVKCWGENWNGQTGSGTMNTGKYTPVDVIGLTERIQAVTAGGYHTCALAGSGEVVECWGDNQYGQLGDGTMQTSKRPVPVLGLAGKVVAVSAGWYHTCALTKEGKAFCWGRNDGGALGDGTYINRSLPVQPEELSGGLLAISAGMLHTCAVTGEGGVKCWGDGSYGELGDGESRVVNTPVDAIGLDKNVAGVSAGSWYSCGLMRSGEVKCWGKNELGQLGDGTTNDSHTPVPVTVVNRPMIAISAGWVRTCVVTVDGQVLCWGNVQAGKLGEPISGYDPRMVEVIDLTDSKNP